ncbi:hypothetical protein [Bariatricus sp. SGI.019]|uniref:hypothetical protein n=1 Tax=Bariatricus sp. SGI.019 TaxID=3420548 RepID=UPI003D051ABB
MQNILLNNGKIIPILSKDDALEVIEEYLGTELAAYFKDILYDMNAIDEEITSLENDKRNLEEENEELEQENEMLEQKLVKLESELEKYKNEKEDNDDSLPFC